MIFFCIKIPNKKKKRIRLFFSKMLFAFVSIRSVLKKEPLIQQKKKTDTENMSLISSLTLT